MLERNGFTVLGGAALAAVLAVVPAASAVDGGSATLVDGNSSATIDYDSDAGMSSWIVDDVNHLYQQWFWYRIGDSGGEESIDTLDLGVHGTTDTNFDGDDDTLFIEYLGEGFSIEIRFVLAGGLPGSSVSDIAEQISINNFGEEPLDFHLFQYSDFDLNNSSSDDTIVLRNDNTWRQTDDGIQISETVVTPAATHFQAAPYGSLLTQFDDDDPTTLTDSGGPLGPADVTWAFQWDSTIAAGGTLLISKDKSIHVPAPGAALLGMMGLGMVRSARRRIA